MVLFAYKLIARCRLVLKAEWGEGDQVCPAVLNLRAENPRVENIILNTHTQRHVQQDWTLECKGLKRQLNNKFFFFKISQFHQQIYAFLLSFLLRLLNSANKTEVLPIAAAIKTIMPMPLHQHLYFYGTPQLDIFFLKGSYHWL